MGGIPYQKYGALLVALRHLGNMVCRARRAGQCGPVFRSRGAQQAEVTQLGCLAPLPRVMAMQCKGLPCKTWESAAQLCHNPFMPYPSALKAQTSTPCHPYSSHAP